MDLNNLLIDVKEILDADGDYTNLLNQEIYAPSIQIDWRNVYFILHHVNNEGIIEKSLVVYENRLTAGDFEAQATMDDRDSTLLVGELNERNNDALAKRFQWIRPTSRRNYKYTFGLEIALAMPQMPICVYLKDVALCPFWHNNQFVS